MIPQTGPTGSVLVIDNAVPQPARLRRKALSASYGDYDAPDGEIYRRVAVEPVPGLREAIEKAVGPVEMLGMGYRLNFGGEMPNAAIHSDMGWGTHAAVLYLSERLGGTAFWRHRATGAERIQPGDVELLAWVEPDWDDASQWMQTQLVEMRLGRLVIYESELFHSRWPFEAFGAGPADGRLIAVAFFTPLDRLRANQPAIEHTTSLAA